MQKILAARDPLFRKGGDPIYVWNMRNPIWIGKIFHIPDGPPIIKYSIDGDRRGLA
jgi:hypothetical protein